MAGQARLSLDMAINQSSRIRCGLEKPICKAHPVARTSVIGLTAARAGTGDSRRFSGVDRVPWELC